MDDRVGGPIGPKLRTYTVRSGTHCLERVSVHANIGNWHTEIDVYTNLYNAFGLVLGGVHQSIYVYPER